MTKRIAYDSPVPKPAGDLTIHQRLDTIDGQLQLALNQAMDRPKPDLQTLDSLTTRMMLAAELGFQFGTHRNLYRVLGYDRIITWDQYAAQYLRDPIAKAIIDRPVTATWRGDFHLVESKDEEDTELEKAWDTLYTNLQLRSRFARLDRLAGIGFYGALLLGFNDVREKNDLTKQVVKSGSLRLLYVRPFSGMTDQGPAQIQEYETNPGNERYGRPITYSIKVVNTNGSMDVLRVHWSRVLHVADDMLQSEVEGTPRLQAVWNRLMDLDKIVGGAAEMFWRGARPGYNLNADKDFQIPPSLVDDLRDQVDEYENDLVRILVTKGLDLKTMGTQVSSPKAHFDICLQEISAETGIPLRVLTGSEQAHLASTQDRDNWFDLVDTRREEKAEPCIIRPFVDYMTVLGLLPPPQDLLKGYSINWQDLRATSDADKAKIGNERANAWKAFHSQPTAEESLAPWTARRIILGMNDDENALAEQELEAWQQTRMVNEEAQAALDQTPVGAELPPEPSGAPSEPSAGGGVSKAAQAGPGGGTKA